MANSKSSKKRARQSLKRHEINLTRKSSIKTAIKKVLTALENKDASAKELLVDAESQLARAGSKGTFHKKTARRKISRLAKKVSQASQSK